MIADSKILTIGTYVEAAIGIGGMIYGIFSAVWPKRSIAIYEWMMSRVNWQVVPIDERREVRMTRLLGVLLAAVCVDILVLLYLGIH